MHPTMIEMLAKAYEQEKLAEARRMRLLHLAKRNRSQLSKRVLGACGDLFIQVGMKLKKRAAVWNPGCS